jgi:hypothetical protein
MQVQIFRELVSQIFELAKIPDAQSVKDTANLEVDGIKFTLMDSRIETESAVAVYCDFGEPPKARRADVLQLLLELNCAMSGANAPIFSINIETGHVILSCRVLTGKLTATDVLNILAQNAAQAKEWRKTYYLQNQNAPRSASERASAARWMSKQGHKIEGAFD